MKRILFATVLLLTLFSCATDSDLQQNLSTEAKMYIGVIKFMDGRITPVSTLELANKFIKKQLEKPREIYSLPKKFAKLPHIKESYGNTDIYRFNIQDGSGQDKLIFFHGGAYTVEITNDSINMALSIGDALDAEVILGIYPLAPYCNASQAHEEMLALYHSLSTDWSDERVILMGDSAGGGFALAFAQKIIELSLYPTEHLVLISPWLDIAVSNPRITDVMEEGDHLLDAVALAYLGDFWRGDLEVVDPLVSPLWGSLKGIGDFTIISSSNEIFIPDIHDLVEKLEKEEIPFNYHEFENIFHDFPVFNFPEAEDAVNLIINSLRG